MSTLAIKDREEGEKYFCPRTGVMITLGVAGAAAFTFANQDVAQAQITAETVTAEVEKFQIVNDAIVALVQAFTLVMIMPMGVRAGNQLFKHLILASM